MDVPDFGALIMATDRLKLAAAGCSERCLSSVCFVAFARSPLQVRLGYQSGPATGRMNLTTQFAIMKFEERERLPIKGEASSVILNALLSKITD